MPSTLHGDRGSIPLVLLIVIATSGLMAVLFARTISAQEQVRFDRDFAHALPVADAGIEVALHKLNAHDTFVDAATNIEHEFVAFPEGAVSVPETVELDGQTSTWTIERVDESFWTVRSTSTINGVRRTVVGTIEEQPLPFMAAFTNDELNFGGGNIADSYNSATRRWCTNLGVVGSNEAVTFSGEATSGHCANANGRTVDAVHLFDWARADRVITGTSALYPAGSECKKNGAADHGNCREIVTASYTYPGPRLVDERLDLATENAVAFIAGALDQCRASSGALTNWVATDHGNPAVLSPAPNAQDAMERGDVTMAGAYYCYDSMRFNRNTVVHPSASPMNPVIIFVRGSVNVSPAGGGGGSNAVKVGCTDCPSVVNAGGLLHPHQALEAGSLRIFVLEGDVLLSNQTQFTGVIYAPNSVCSGPNSNAQADVYGSVVCDNLANAGGWRFHYDEALGGLRSGEFALARWAEEVPDAP